MGKLKIGDRVIAVGDFLSVPLQGKEGTVTDIEARDEFDGDNGISVDFDEDVGGWDCHGKCKDDHGFICFESMLELSISTNLNAK